MRTVILFAICVPIIFFLVNYAQKKNRESEIRMKQCETQCREQGYDGHIFKWGITGGPNCECIRSD